MAGRTNRGGERRPAEQGEAREDTEKKKLRNKMAIRNGKSYVRTHRKGITLAICSICVLLVLFISRGFLRGGSAAARSRALQEEGQCADLNPMCVAWHKAGACRRQVRGVNVDMATACPRTCGLCEGDAGRVPPVARTDACQRDNFSAAVPYGRLDLLFERVLRDFPEYSPRALSKEPWIVSLDNFLSDEEADAFLSSCESHFERSLAGDQLNPVRTSFQCWCNFPRCYTDPLVHRVAQRIGHVTGTAYNNGEDFQIVRYEPGQFYKVHHDQNTAVWAPQGPRVLTFFMYLNTPDGGGGTRFPGVRLPGVAGGLTVEPRKGSAILWPSTLNEQPMSQDGRTNHEALPVTEGIKFGANMWIHQFDFKTPSERGCPLTYVNTLGTQPLSQEHRRLVAGGRVPTGEETVAHAMDPHRGALYTE